MEAKSEDDQWANPITLSQSIVKANGGIGARYQGEAEKVKRSSRIFAIVAGMAILLVLGLWAGFRRQYVVPAAGLLDVTTRATPHEVIVSGVLLSSMARVTKTTVAPYKDGVLVRVYVDLIRPGDGSDQVMRSFSARVPRPRSSVIYIGDDQAWETVGQFFGALAVRVPREKEWAAKAVWREAAR